MLRAKQRFGKYIIERRLGEGGFAVVYQARDTIEGIRVALKIPYDHLVTDDSLDEFRHEVRLAAKLEHPNILPLKYADYVDDHFVIVMSMGQSTLEERLQKRMAVDTALRFTKQMLEAVAYAHEQKIVHCDLKPDNFLIFPDQRLRLTDFGIARVAQKTLKGSGAGTLGYISPEQAMGKPSFRSDVFALGVIMHRLLAGTLPEWPYKWPFPGHDRLKQNVHSDLVSLVRKATEVEASKRYRDAGRMLEAFRKIKQPKKSNSRAQSKASKTTTTKDWRVVRHKEFQRQFGKQLETRHNCQSCGGPVSEVMCACPWCGKARKKHTDDNTRFTVECPRCERGLKSDWCYCPWCFGPGFEPSTRRKLTDRRYVARCSNSMCDRKELMPFMRYCPWCKSRVKKQWKIEGSETKCRSCGCGVAEEFWDYCPWCTKRLANKK